MRNVVSLSTYLGSYNLTREVFDKEVEKDKDFYNKYIEWGSKKDGSDTILSPKALDRLGEIFNDSVISEDIDSSPEEVETIEKIDEETEKKEDIQMDMSEFMEKPVEAEEEKNIEKKAEKKTVKSTENKRKKKSKLNITKQFIQEHGQTDMDDGESNKQLRKFLMNDGTHKIEEVALMTDEEVRAAFGKEFYVIKAQEGTYFIKRTALMGIMGDVFVVESE